MRWFDSARECAVLLRSLEATLVSDKQPHSRTRDSLIGTAVPMMHELVELIYDKQQNLVTPSVQVQSIVHFQSVSIEKRLRRLRLLRLSGGLALPAQAKLEICCL